jgi:predicted acetyltransferase
MILSKPSVKYKESFLKAINEPGAEKLFKRFGLEKDFEKYIKKINNYSKSAPLLRGSVPESTFWIIDDDEYVGRVSIRHKLTKELEEKGGHIGIDIRPSKRGKGYGKNALNLALKKAAEIGLNKVLLTCKSTNIPSKKIIESNDGKLIDENNRICRYKIIIK